jgi:serine/threonine protein phosphatase PrpC
MGNYAQPIHLSVAGRTEVGLSRRKNEDAFVVADLTRGDLLNPEQPIQRFDVRERGVLLAVSDGMGGHKAGEIASALVVRSLTHTLEQAPKTLPGDALLKDAVERAHRDVRDAANDEARRGMGATLTALLVQGETATIAEIGDSRAYLVRAGTIVQLTHDQSYGQLLLDSGAIGHDEAEKSGMSNVLLQAMGHDATIQVALGKLALRKRDCFVLCSDGLTKYVSEEEIRDCVLSSPGPDAACAKLVDLPKARGGGDDVTVVVAGVGGGVLPASSAAEGVESTFEILESFEPKLRS